MTYTIIDTRQLVLSIAGALFTSLIFVSAATSLPIAVGFGLSKPEHLTEVAAFADAAVVGSALVSVIGDAGPSAPANAGAFVRWLKGR